MQQHRIPSRVLLLGLGLLLTTGCAGYRVGADSLYPPDIHTVYVPMFESDSFRRDLGERLTEAVVKQIELRTPYKVVSSPNADSVLTGRIKGETKRTIVQDINGQPRAGEVNFVVTVSWVTSHGEQVTDDFGVPLPPEVITLNQSGSVIPEYGQSIATGQQQAIDRMARQIVTQMEAPW